MYLPDYFKEAALLFLEKHPPSTVYQDDLDFERTAYAFLCDHFKASTITKPMVRNFSWTVSMLMPRRPQ